MKPSRIVKSAHARAGLPIPVKQYARQIIDGTINASARLVLACEVWLTGKRTGKVYAGKFTPINGPGPTAEQIAETKFKREKQAAKNGVPGWGVQ